MENLNERLNLVITHLQQPPHTNTKRVESCRKCLEEVLQILQQLKHKDANEIGKRVFPKIKSLGSQQVGLCFPSTDKRRTVVIREMDHILMCIDACNKKNKE